MEEIVHGDKIDAACPPFGANRRIAAGNPDAEDLFDSISYSQEGKASFGDGAGRYVLTKDRIIVDVEKLDRRAAQQVHVGKYRAEACNRGRLRTRSYRE